MKNLYKSLALFQQDVPIIHKDSKGYNYTYTGLASIVETITPLLKKHGLGFTQPLGNNSIKTILFHFDSGETIESETTILADTLEYVEIEKKGKENNVYKVNQILGFEGMNKAQAYGSLITYFRRYSLSSLLGLITDTDSDARNKRIADKENQRDQFEELKELAKLADVNITDMTKSYKTKGYDITKNRLQELIKKQNNEI